MEAHLASINCIDVLPGRHIFVTGAADATVKVWAITFSVETNSHDISIVLQQEIGLAPKFFPLTVAIASLSSETSASKAETILAVAGTKASIQIYVSKGIDYSSGCFELIASLTGHEAWIRSLTITAENINDDFSDLLLASASQDRYIRLWRIHRGQDLPASNRAMNDPALGILAKSLSNKAHRFSTASQQFSITFEALLLGHEDWIYSTSWQRHDSHLQLLTASADSSLAVWQADEASGIWMCVARLGEISAQKGSTSATGSTGGFWAGLWSPDASAVVSLGRTGSWRLWERDGAVDDDHWTQASAVTGHVKEVNGIAWSRHGDYLLSTSNDQTTRLHAEWKLDGSTSWHEFSRPQIHGYDLNCIDVISGTQFISGADEKLLRVFDEPEGVAEILSRLCGIERVSGVIMPDAANIPVLGLSNKAIKAVDDGEVPVVDENDRDAPDPASIAHKSTLKFNQPPLEDHLARHMLWPEREKLYGHGYEINVVAASRDGSLVATACRASSIDHAVIRLYETKDWREIKPPLKAHTLTVTDIQFSPDDEYLLSVGRDRQWFMFHRDLKAAAEYTLAHSDPKAHSRMILSASWGPLSVGRMFATGGRDKSIKIWKIEGGVVKCVQTILNTIPVTALAFLSQVIEGCVVLAYGLEDGRVFVCRLGAADCTIQRSDLLFEEPVGAKAVIQLAWRPLAGEMAGIQKQDFGLAIASLDSSLRIASVTLG